MMIKIGAALSDLYKIEDRFSAGGSSIWKVHHKIWETDISMREPAGECLSDPDKLGGFLNICSRWAKMGFHPNIVPCYYVREIDKVPYVFSEWCEDRPLSSMIFDGSLYTGTDSERDKRIASIAFQTMLGIQHAHKNNIVHGRIDPQNIVVSDNGTARLTYFGSTEPETDEYSALYLALEQSASDAETKTCGFWSDIYSWALSVAEMYCGEYFREAETEDRFAASKLLALSRADISGDLCSMLIRCLDKNCRLRPSADELISFLEKEFEAILSDDIAFCRVNTEYTEDIPNALNNKALCCLDMNDRAKAEEYWKKAALCQLDNSVAVYNYNIFLWLNGKKETPIPGMAFMSHSHKLLKDWMYDEIHSCCGARAKARLMRRTPFDGFVDLSAEYPDIDYICFSRDSRQILAASKAENSLKICEISSDELILDIPLSDGLPEEYKENFCKPISCCRGMSLTADEPDSICCFVKDEKSSRIIGSVLCNYPSISADPENRYSFSPDGKMIAVPDCGNDGIAVYSIPQNSQPRMPLCKFGAPAELLDRKRRFLELRKLFNDSMNKKDYKIAAQASNKMSRLNVNISECVQMKARLLPVCMSCHYVPLLKMTLPRGTSQLRVSCCGKYAAYRAPSALHSICIAAAHCTKNENDVTGVDFSDEDEIVDFWFDKQENLCIMHMRRKEREFEKAPLFLTVFDTAHRKKETDLIAFCSGKYLRTGHDSLPQYEKSDVAIIDRKLYAEASNAPYSARSIVPSSLSHYCRMHHLSAREISKDYTVLTAEDDSEILIFYVDYDLIYDPEIDKEFNT